MTETAATPTPTIAIPCGHLVEASGPFCQRDHNFPADCQGCADYTPGISDEERTRCEIWTRVMGYHRPVSAFNAGKQAEHRERQHFSEHPKSATTPRQESAT